MRWSFSFVVVGILAAPAPGGIPEPYRPAVGSGLAWLAKQQQADGRWSAKGHGDLETTSLAGLALLLESSGLRESPYREQLHKATVWVISQSQSGKYDGLLGRPGPERYHVDHVFAMLFLCEIYGDVEDRGLREKLRNVLTRAVQYTHDNQSGNGGWPAAARADAGDADDSAVTVLAVHALRSARNVGLAVKREVLSRAVAYLRESVAADGGVAFRTGKGRESKIVGAGRADLTAAALAGLPLHVKDDRDLLHRWHAFCREKLRPAGAVGGDEDLLTHFYYARALFALGEDGFGKLFEKVPEKDRLTWPRYRTARFDQILKAQNGDGSWGPRNAPSAWAAAMHLLVLQTDHSFHWWHR